MQTTASGNQEETCTSYPFGDGLNCTGPSADATEQHFTGKERDAESGLDYFFARYYSSILGRFMTPDWAAAPTAVPYATFGDPQTLNLYAYVNNNPNTGIDLDGHVGGADQETEEAAAEATENSAASESAGNGNPETQSTQDAAANRSKATNDSGQNKKPAAPGPKPAPAPPNPSPKKPDQNPKQPGQNTTSNKNQQDQNNAFQQANNKCLAQAGTAAKDDYDAAKTPPKARTVVGGGLIGAAAGAIFGGPVGAAFGAAAGAFQDEVGGGVVGTAKATSTYNGCMMQNGQNPYNNSQFVWSAPAP